jgi:hypothetical protein
VVMSHVLSREKREQVIALGQLGWSLRRIEQETGVRSRNTDRNRKKNHSQPTGPTGEGLDYRFLRSQPRVIGHGSLCKARPRQSEYNITTQSNALNINAPLSSLQSYTSAR